MYPIPKIGNRIQVQGYTDKTHAACLDLGDNQEPFPSGQRPCDLAWSCSGIYAPACSSSRALAPSQVATAHLSMAQALRAAGRAEGTSEDGTTRHWLPV